MHILSSLAHADVFICINVIVSNPDPSTSTNPLTKESPPATCCNFRALFASFHCLAMLCNGKPKELVPVLQGPPSINKGS